MLTKLFNRCLNIKYKEVENAGSYATETVGTSLYIYLESSNGVVDWKNNFDFPARPYSDFSGSPWYAHRGFTRVFKSILPYLKNDILNTENERIVTVGYSHGAAIAVLVHEYIWYNRPDIRDSIDGYGFGCPRVIWGVPSAQKLLRWERFTVIRNIDDIVTHLPPIFTGYFHVGRMISIGERGKYSSVDAHRAENILAELYNCEK